MKVFETDLLSLELAEQASVAGQCLIKFDDDFSGLEDLSLEDQLRVWNATNLVASTLFENLQAQGTNVIIREGTSLSIDVLPRSQGDGIDLFWNPERADPAALEQVASKIKDRLWFVNKELSSEDSVSEPVTENVTSDINLKVQHILDRSP